MRLRNWVLASAALAAFAYVAYPYVTLARLGAALRGGDASTLERLIAWGSVREGIKEDISDDIADTAATAGNTLRPFGYSFIRGVAANVVDSRVSPRGLLAAARHIDPAALTLDAVSGVRWAFFDGSPTAFVAELRPPGDAAASEPVRVQLELRGIEWKVTRVWLPHKLLMAANDPS
jgi:hypothetical protein